MVLLALMVMAVHTTSFWWLLLLPPVAAESLLSLRRINQHRGTLSLLSDGQLDWHQRQWQLVARPWLTRYIILLCLRDGTGQRQRLWLFADAVSVSQWRQLRQRLLMAETSSSNQ